MEQIHLWPQASCEEDDQITVSAIFEAPGSEPETAWFRLPAEYKNALTKGCDPFVIGLLFKAMRAPADLVVHGEVSPSLLCNLDEFQAAWTSWKPERFSKIEILADAEREQTKADTSATVMSFSGGLDSCFTAHRHHTGSCGRLQRNLRAGVFLHGFDIPLRLKDDFERAASRVKIMLDSLGIAMIPMATNLKKLLEDYWGDAHGSNLAACLTLLQGGFEAGLIAGGIAYAQNVYPWGSNPITDRLLSSQSFEIVHDGASLHRLDKTHEIALWPEALQHMRICLVGLDKDRNCCRCEKCIRTILDFRAWGLGLPPCFEQDVTNAQILKLKYLFEGYISHYEAIFSIARKTSPSESWVRALAISIFLNQWGVRAEKYFPIRRIKRLIAR